MVSSPGGKTDPDFRHYDGWVELECADNPASVEQATVRYKCYPIKPRAKDRGYWIADMAVQFIVGMILIGLLCVGYVVMSGALG